METTVRRLALARISHMGMASWSIRQGGSDLGTLPALSGAGSCNFPRRA